jgi:hypothetical protein
LVPRGETGCGRGETPRIPWAIIPRGEEFHSAGGLQKSTAPRRERCGRQLWTSAQASLLLAISVSWVKAALSLMAISESILRLMVIFAFFSPFMKVE